MASIMDNEEITATILKRYEGMSNYEKALRLRQLARMVVEEEEQKFGMLMLEGDSVAATCQLAEVMHAQMEASRIHAGTRCYIEGADNAPA